MSPYLRAKRPLPQSWGEKLPHCALRPVSIAGISPCPPPTFPPTPTFQVEAENSRRIMDRPPHQRLLSPLTRLPSPGAGGFWDPTGPSSPNPLVPVSWSHPKVLPHGTRNGPQVPRVCLGPGAHVAGVGASALGLPGVGTLVHPTSGEQGWEEVLKP